MSIVEKNLTTSFEVHTPRLELVRSYPQPADTFMANGIAIIGEPDTRQLEILEDKLVTEFATMERSVVRKYGACILYAIDSPYEAVMRIDDVIEDTTAVLSNGPVVKEADKGDTLWRGQCGNMRYSLRKRINDIVFEDYSSKKGLIYSLRSTLDLPN